LPDKPLEFFFALDRNLEDVDAFYNKKLADSFRRLHLLHDKYSPSPEAVAQLDQDEKEELIGALLELRNQFRKLQWFGEINRRGFVKITKKLDKKIPNVENQQRYITTKVDPKPFARDNTTRVLADINKWLSVLGDAQPADDSKSDWSGRSLGRAAGKILTVPQTVLDTLDQATRNDDLATLEANLSDKSIFVSELSSQPLLFSLLQRSISLRSKQCVRHLLGKIHNLDELDDINGRNCVHRLIIHTGRNKSAAASQDAGPFPFSDGARLSSQYLQPAASAIAPLRPLNEKEADILEKDDQAVQMLTFILENLSPGQRSALTSEDSLGRLPLHYAAQFGFVVICEILVAKMREWGQFDSAKDVDDARWKDKNGDTPLHLSVRGGHPFTTQTLIKAGCLQVFMGGPGEASAFLPRPSGDLLATATKANFSIMVQMLLDAGADANWQDKSGEAALHVAARFGYDACAKVLLSGAGSQKADLEITEKSYAWTPLHVACVDGHLSTVTALVDAGADVNKLDASGWTAKEHAALRGHMDIARFLARLETDSIVPELESRSVSPRPDKLSIEERRSNGAQRVAEPLKSFGHRYLKNEALILVSLGSMDMRKNIQPVELEQIPLTTAHLTGLDTALSVVISARGAQGEATIVDLPVHDHINTEPIVFTTQDPSKVQLRFDIVPTYAGSDTSKIGRGVALLSSIKPSLGTKRMNLQGDVCIPIIASNLEYIGTVNFNFLVITPFSHPNMEVTSRQTYWKKLSSTMVIGHRGLGQNVSSTSSLQLGENTVPSFIAAANLGAQYVEFDVQLTKDHVPVIYHDFLVSETGIDAPVHTLTLEQFLHINPDSTRTRNGLPIQRSQGSRVRSSSVGARQRSHSFGPTREDPMEERMKHTIDFKNQGYKANSRGKFIQAPFATLEELFHKLPENVGFNIEMKYPMLHETEMFEMDMYAVELNSFCDTVLAKVYELAGDRHIVFSSSNPDMCLCLNFKQPSMPIMFITDSGTEKVSDIRASSLQEAIRFARRWNLLGIVSAAEPFVNSPRMIRVVRENGLVLATYGSLNNDPLMVQVIVSIL
jgi:glycerophosphodiester phosphodiesterase